MNGGVPATVGGTVELMGVVKQTLKESLALIAIAFVLGAIGNEMKGEARIEWGKNYFAKWKPLKEISSPVDPSSPVEASSPVEVPSPADHVYQEISFDQLAEAFLAGEAEAGAMLLVDARGDDAFAGGHMPWAVQCDHFRLERFIRTVTELAKAADRVVVYCNGGDCEDSILVCGDLMEFDVPYDKIYLFKGGWEEWTREGNNMPVAGGGGY
jgi:rhodanese-related sulfurtransferase